MAGLYSAVDPYYQTSLISVVTETNFKNNDIFNTEHGIVPGDRVESSIPEEIAINLLIYHKYCLNFNTYI